MPRKQAETRDLVQQAMDQITVAPRMARMAELFSAAEAMPAAEPWRSRDMVARCLACRHTDHCAQVLCAGKSDAALTAFCPNTGHFRTLAARLRDGAIFVASGEDQRLTWPDREAGWDRRCDSHSDS